MNERIKVLYEKSCLSKANLQQDLADKIVDKAAKEGLCLYYYKCKLCNSFHMTSKIPTGHQQEASRIL